MSELVTNIHPIGSGGSGGDPVAIDSQDGKIVRIRPLHWDSKYTAEELEGRLWEFESKGLTFKCPTKAMPPWYSFAYKKRVYTKSRVKYPLKRVDWEPGGDPEKVNAHNRGKSKFKPISWDEAIDIMESEIRRMYDTYGPGGILAIGENGHKESKAIHYAGGCHMQLLRLLGGFVREVRTPDSVEGWYWGGKHVWGTGAYMGMGTPECYENCVTDISDNTDFIVLQSGDLENSQAYSHQFWSRVIKFWLDQGKKFVSIDPFGSYTSTNHREIKWIPLLPNTDVALDFAIIYTWIKEDTYDKEHIASHTVGFEKIVPYVMGEEDGIPKTPEWASEITGIPEWTIKALARKWAKETTSTGHFCGTFVRGPYSHECGRTEYYKLAMQGMGKPGVQMIHLFSFQVAPHANANNEKIPPSGGQMSASQNGHVDMFYPNERTLPRTLVSKAIKEGHCEWWGSPSIIMADRADQFIKREWPRKDLGDDQFHMMWSEKNSNINSWNGGFSFAEACRDPKIEFFVCNHQWLQGDSIYADLVLPVSSCVEEEDVGSGTTCQTSLQFYTFHDAATEPVGDPKSDYEIMVEIAKRFGVEEQITNGFDRQREFQFNFDTSAIGQTGEITLEEIKEKGYYVPKLYEGWQDLPSAMENWYNDPEKYPLATPSGKIEFYSEELAKNFPDDKERQPMAKYIIGGSEEDGYMHDESLYGEKCKQYPLLMNANPARWRIHGQNGDNAWLREIPTCKIVVDGYAYEPCWMNKVDADARGIKDGDIVKVHNNEGIVLCAAKISERIMPQSVMVAKGGYPDPLTNRIDRGGCINNICPTEVISKHCAGFVVTGYLVEVEKLEQAEMEQWKQDYAEEWNRAYDLASGSHYDAWVEGVE